MKNNLTITQWAKVMGYKKLDNKWFQDTTTGEKRTINSYRTFQANTRIDFENKKIYMIGSYMENALYYNQQASLCDYVGADMIELLYDWDEI